MKYYINNYNRYNNKTFHLLSVTNEETAILYIQIQYTYLCLPLTVLYSVINRNIFVRLYMMVIIIVSDSFFFPDRIKYKFIREMEELLDFLKTRNEFISNFVINIIEFLDRKNCLSLFSSIFFFFPFCNLNKITQSMHRHINYTYNR